MHLKPVIAVLAVSLLALTPAVPFFADPGTGAAFAKGEGGGGGGAGGGGGGGGKSESKKSEKAASKATGKIEASAKAKKPKAAEEKVKVAKSKPAKEGELAPNELGKMNGAMNANMNAVFAHIRNGQTDKGPVGLLAGLAVADAGAAEVDGKAAELQELADSFDELGTALAEEGFATPEEYLQAKADGTLTQEQIDRIDPLVDAAGGTDASGLTLAETKPTPEDIAAAEAAATEAGLAVADAEQAILDAWNKDGDPDALLTGLRDKLAPYQAEIAAAVAESEAVEEPATVTE